MLGTVWWDFDGTLAHRHGIWVTALLAALEEVAPGHPLTEERIRPFLTYGFPWHEPEVLHPDLDDPDAWWAHQAEVIRHAYIDAGLSMELAQRAAAHVRAAFLDPTMWALLPHAMEALELTRGAGLKNVIVSNHTPELPGILETLGLLGWIDHVVNSATVGAEKPNPRIFAVARSHSVPGGPIWMVGDNPVADIAGAAGVGVPGILVRGAIPNASELTVLDAANQILAESRQQLGDGAARAATGQAGPAR